MKSKANAAIYKVVFVKHGQGELNKINKLTG
jgi:bisphosphoglycerate-dependent phosphoglycerate mutase